MENNMEIIENNTETEFLERTMETFENCTEVTDEPSTSKPPRKKPKMVKEWEEEDIYKLIALVEAEKCLWDASDESYHNKSMRDRAWRHIKENFKGKYTEIDLNVKWTNLRIQYLGYAGKAKTKSGQGFVEAPKWRFYNVMSFVGRAEHKQTQHTVSNIVFTVEEENSSSKSSETDTQSTSKQRKQLSCPTQSVTTQIAETMREAVDTMKQRKESALDPNIAFANYLVSELKTLNPDSVGAIRKRVTIYFLECLEEERKKEFT